MRGRKLKLTLLAVLALGLGMVAWYSTSYLSLADLAERERALREVIASRPFASWIVGFVVYFAASLIPGTRGKVIVFGWLFGFLPALVLVNVALTLAAIVTFKISRHLLQDTIESRYAPRLVWLNRALDREGAWYVILLRVLPISYSLTNYLLGATRLRTRTFWWATHIGLLPGNAVFTFVGSQLPTLGELSRKGVMAFISWEVIAALIVLSVFPLVLHRLALRWRPSVTSAINRRSPPIPF